MSEKRKGFGSLGLERFSGLYLWVMFIVIFGFWKPDLFLTSQTLHSVASSQAVLAMVALAVLIPLAAGSYDLSVGSTINLSTVLVVVLQSNKGWSPVEAILFSVACAVLIGVVNGFIVVKMGINSFIATLGMATIIGATQTIVSGSSQPAPPSSTGWAKITQTTFLGFPLVFAYLIILALLVWWALERTPAGRYIHAIGGNAEAARLSGVLVGKWTWLSLVASSTICGVAGVLYASFSGPSLTFGASLLLPAYAAVFLGSTQLTPGKFNVWGTLIAVYVLATGVTGLQFVTGVPWLNDMFNGVALIAAVGFAVWRQRIPKPPALRRAPEPQEGPPKNDATVQATPAPVDADVS